MPYNLLHWLRGCMLLWPKLRVMLVKTSFCPLLTIHTAGKMIMDGKSFPSQILTVSLQIHFFSCLCTISMFYGGKDPLRKVAWKNLSWKSTFGVPKKCHKQNKSFNNLYCRVVHFAKKWDSYPSTSFLEAFYLVMKENAKKVGESYHLGVTNWLWSLCTVRQ